MYILDFGNIQFTDNNIKGKLDYLHQINPSGDMVLGVAAMAELKFTLYDLNQVITDADITGREFTFKKSKTSTYLSKWDIFRLTKPDIMCLNGDTVYSVKNDVFSIDGNDVTQQPTEPVKCIYIVDSKVYLGHTDEVSVYTLNGLRQADITLTPFQKTQIVQGASLNMQGNTLKEYSTRFFDMRPNDFIEKTSVFTTVGIFTAVEPERKNKTNITVKSLDRMYKFGDIVDTFINDFTYPVTAYNLLKEICQKVGVPLFTTAITNGNYSITKKFSVSNTTYRTIIQYIAELSGNFAYIDDLGRLVLRFYESTEKVYASKNFKTIRQLEFTTAKIDKVQVKTSTNDNGVIVPKGEEKPNAYVIENNPLMYTMSDAVLRPYVQNLFDKLKNFQYIPTEFTTVLDNDFEGNVGELVFINGTQVPIFVKRIKGLIETYSSTGNAVRDTQTSRVNESIKMLNGRTNEIIATVDEFSVTLTEVKDVGEQNTAQLLVQAGQIALKANRTQVDGLDNRLNEAETSITLNTQEIALKANQTEVDSVTGRVESAESAIIQNANDITFKVSQTDYNGNTISSLINQTATSIKIQASKINLSGYTTFSDLTDGITTISGNNIRTGTVSADRLESNVLTSNNIQSKNLTITGTFLTRGSYGGVRIENGIAKFTTTGWGDSGQILYKSSGYVSSGIYVESDTGACIDARWRLVLKSGSDGMYLTPRSGGDVFIGSGYSSDRVYVGSSSNSSSQNDLHARGYYAEERKGYTGSISYMKSETSRGTITVTGGIITNVS